MFRFLVFMVAASRDFTSKLYDFSIFARLGMMSPESGRLYFCTVLFYW